MMKTKSKKKIADALHDVRLTLLDHKACKHLLHFNQTGWERESLRLVHELPDQLADRLLSGLEMRFLAVPEPQRDALVAHGYLRIDEGGEELVPLRKQPDSKEWATCLGLADALTESWNPHSMEAAVIALENSYGIDLETEIAASPSSAERDLAIQSLLFPHELPQCLLNLSLAADSIIKETGSNNLYMAFGFLEWFSPGEENPKKTSLAPLLLLPVRLYRNPAHDADSIHAYTIRASGEDVLCNLPLWEKLRVDFDLTLPEPDSPFQAQSYFYTLINLITAQQPDWVVRPLIVLSLFRPHEAVLYHDLAPERWSNNDGLTRHPLICSLLEPQSGEASCEESQTNIKTPVAEAEPFFDNNSIPLVGKADKAQLKALSLALSGASLVIEGPPGTGKSQSIANLIAAALAMNETVLFVAEKRAALEVVWRRLQQTRLGTFCLELHSDKLEKNQVLQAVRARLEWHGQYRSQEEIDTELALYAREQEKLRHHVASMEQSWRETGKTLHWIFTAAVQGRSEIESIAGLDLTVRDLYPHNLDGQNLNPAKQTLLEESIEQYTESYAHIAAQLPSDTSLRQYPWYGINYAGDDPLRCSQIQQHFAIWQHDLHSLAQEYRQTLEHFAVPLLQTTDRLEDIAAFQEELRRVPVPQGTELLDMVPKLHGAMLERCRNYQLFFEKILSSYADLARILPPEVMNNLDAAPGYVKGCENLLRQVIKYYNLNTLSRAVKSLVDLQRELANMQSLMQEIGTTMGRGAPAYLVTTEEGLIDFRDCILLAAMLPEKCWEKRHARFDQYELDVFLSRLADDLRGLHILREALQEHFDLARLPDKQELRALHGRLEQGGMLRLLKSSWQEDRKALLALAPDPRNAHFAKMLELLPRAEEMAVKMRELDGNWKYQELLGEHLQGMSTDLHSLQSLRSWYQAVRGRFGRGSALKADLAEIMLELSTEALEDLHILNERAIPQKIDTMLNDLAELKKIFPQVAALQSTDMLLHEGKGPIAAFVRSLLAAIHACQPIATDPSMSIATLHELSQKLLRLHEAVFIWERSDPDYLFFEGRLELNPRMGARNSAGMAILRSTLNIAGYLEDERRDPAVRAYLRNHLKSGFIRAHEAAARLDAALKAERDSFETFQQIAELDTEAWLRNTNEQVGRILTKNTRALRRISELQSWLKYVQARNQLVQEGLAFLPPLMEQRKLLPEQAIIAHRAGLYNLLEEEILAQFPDLSPFADVRQDIVQQDMERYAARQKELQFERIASKLDNTHILSEDQPDVPEDELQGLAFLQHVCHDGQNNNLSLLQVFQRAGTSLQALCPCWLASPMAVARYLQPDALHFDLVIMDEASRIRLSSVLGAIARGNQLVVAGDSRQLLPFDDEDKNDHDGNDARPGRISLFSAALATFPVCELNKHYRSRHASLIAFANQRFYDGRLRNMALEVGINEEEYGIRWHKIEADSKKHNEEGYIGREEAMVIARAIQSHFGSPFYESLAVVVMNALQRRLVIDSIKLLIEQDDQFRIKLAQDSLRPEPLLLKTVEDIQGDERDVIFILLARGPEGHGPGGRGPGDHEQGDPPLGRLDEEQGWRYLNVLLTRSRKRMHVFTSLEADDALLADKENRGSRELRLFLSAGADNSLAEMDNMLADVLADLL